MFDAQQRARAAALLQPPKPMIAPSVGERAAIVQTQGDLDTLRHLAGVASGGGAVNFVVFDCEKNERGPEILEISYVEVAIAAKSVRVTQSLVLVQHATVICNGLYCLLSPNGLAYAGQSTKRCLSDALGEFSGSTRPSSRGLRGWSHRLVERHLLAQ